ncbi:DNase I-like protein, partial [Auriscalpium vulgare]
MRASRIGILGLQETHLQDEHVRSIEQLHGRQFKLFNSSDPDSPGATAGVAFALNRSLVRVDDCTFHELVPGRAAILTMTWHHDLRLTVLNVYAPTAPGPQATFWDQVLEAWQLSGLPAPDFFLGDHNIVDNANDRAPPRAENAAALEAFRGLCLALNVQDAWRASYPDSRQFTFRSLGRTPQTHSRLDRIYVAAPLCASVYEWNVLPSPFRSDHLLVMVRYAPPTAPELGEGRWTLPMRLTSDKIFLDYVTQSGLALEEAISDLPDARANNCNAQLLWQKFK